MYWNLLTFALPGLSCLRVAAIGNPEAKDYKNFDSSPDSEYSQRVKEIINRVLASGSLAEKANSSRIQEMLAFLPSTETKSIEAWTRTRLKVLKGGSSPAVTFGTDVNGGKFYIKLGSRGDVKEEYLPFIITHELCHILADDAVLIYGSKVIPSFLVTTVTTLFLRRSLLECCAAVFVTNAMCHAYFSLASEKGADAFAAVCCSTEEVEQGITFLQECKQKDSGAPLLLRLFVRLYYPSYDSRIAKLKEAIGKNS